MRECVRRKLEELEKTSNDFWNVSAEVGQFLNILTKTKKAKNILELGTSNGYSGIWFALALEETNGKLITIEYSEDRIKMASDNFKFCRLDKFVEIKQGKILEVLANIDKKFDLIFIDASKPEYIEYIKAIKVLVKPGSLIISDNISSHRDEVEDFVKYSYSDPALETVFVPIGTGLLLSYAI